MQDAYQEALDFLDEIDTILSYNLWLDENLQLCCVDLEVSYRSLFMMNAFRLDDIVAESDAALAALWLFKDPE